MNKRFAWTIIFLLFTLIPIGMEITAATDDDPGTVTWTELIVSNLSLEVILALTGAGLGALVLWLPIHFYRAKKKQEKERERLTKQWNKRAIPPGYRIIVIPPEARKEEYLAEHPMKTPENTDGED
ncbi:MAG: hypothetical protein ACREQA_19830 [Candidatus Binatia bacterium]